MTTIDTPTLDAAAERAATAAATVDGVHALGSLLGRASDAVRERVGLASTVPGVKIDTDRADSVTATISLVVDYPHKLREVSGAVRSAVRTALEPLGRGRVDVDVIVTGVFGPFDRDVVAEAEEKADAVAARARETAATVRERTDAAVTRVSEVVDDARARASAATDSAVAASKDIAASAAETVDAAVAKTKDVAAGAAAAVNETVKAARERVAVDDARAEGVELDHAVVDARATASSTASAESANAPAADRADVSDVVAEALEDAAIDIAIAADEVRGDDKTSATDEVQSLVEDEKPRP
ncbi:MULTISPECIES: Asp23/Gls24 family envelope stress response protein [Microbacterium]|uniref:Asp23/Gls24 family envelope stress response protein n=1 Tax=Microbacterium TaxID=33882 RepID=UPI002785D7A3|nr:MULTISPECIES: Asp23/Gls24 family envelope stress response protein [Microbacterium]MDQ1074878.1 putative alkaline shock family protein YloU [Microbacterium sp. SORGH_AS_0969]MDQ1115103.1 putative alkaline shock family protein YloU [Microbacterium testaceum]